MYIQAQTGVSICYLESVLYVLYLKHFISVSQIVRLKESDGKAIAIASNTRVHLEKEHQIDDIK